MRSSLVRTGLGRLVSRTSLLTIQAPSSHGPPCFHDHLSRAPKIHSRSIFGFFKASKKKSEATDHRPGFPLMLELRQRLGQGARPPAPAELAQAFGDFFRWHRDQAYALEDIEVSYLMATYNHLRESYKEDSGFGLSDEVLKLALDNMTIAPEDQLTHAAHVQLAELLFEELMQRRDNASEEEKSPVIENESKDVANFIRILSRCGEPRRARSLIEENWAIRVVRCTRYALWLEVIEGFAKQRATEEILNTIEIMQNYSLPFNPMVHHFITSYYSHRNDSELTKRWYEQPIANGDLPTKRTNRYVLQLCITQNEMQWGDRVLKSMIGRGPENTKDWGIVFQWALAQGKGVDEIERMMKVMVSRSGEKKTSLQPDSEIINGLIRTAILKNDAYTAERCVALGQRWGVTPDALTYLYQLEYRMKVGDVAGAQSSYLQLQAQDMEEPRNHGAARNLAPALNKLVCALSAQPTPDFEAIMRLVEDMKKQKATFEMETVCALSRIHLQRAGSEDLVDLINTHVLPYGLKQRAAVRDVLVNFCLDQTQTVSRMWHAYNILRNLFPEVDRHTRTNLMNRFFERGRSDMACHVFGHMRQQDIGPLRPTVDTYVSCFEGIGQSGDQESLHLVHNMLKLDTQIEPNTKLYNGLMLAFAGCDDPRQSLGFWAEIMHSREGPTYRSIEIAMRTCEEAAFGDRDAREIWARLKRNKVEVSREIFAAYIGALAGQAQFAECVKLIEEFEKAPGYPPDAVL